MMWDAISIANVFIGGLFVTAAGFAAAWMRARERAIRAELSRPRLPAEVEARLEHLQQTVEAIAVEVERVAEAQRFSAKLLAERSPNVPGPAERAGGAGRVITPH
jgi:hypothetical protein